MRKSRRNPKSKLRNFRNLPSEVIIDIISRLPIRSIAICKCVCKPWRDLLHTREFADFHFPKSVPGIVIGHTSSEDFKILELGDELGLERHDLYSNTVTEFDSSIGLTTGCCVLKSSANGLLLFSHKVPGRETLYVCNPISREYIELPNDGNFYSDSESDTFGFGVSKMTRQYKVVRIFNEIENNWETPTLLNVTKSVCLVYVLGTGLWRSIAPPAPFIYERIYSTGGVFVNGNIHWLVENADGSHCISCFDLETETFSTFSPPLPACKRFLVGLVDLGGCLCVCDNGVYEIGIWLMKEYGDEKSWTKEFVIRSRDGYVCDCAGCTEMYPINVFKDGDILMACYDTHLFYYSNKTMTTERIDMFGLAKEDEDCGGMELMLHTSSFLSLRSFPKESVSTF